MNKFYTCLLLLFLLVGSSFTVPTNDYNFVKVKVVNFYPNPATSIINFELVKPLERGHVLQVFNFIGKKVDEVQINTQKFSITLDGYYRGIYIFQLRDKTGQVIESGKFQVVK